jgi:hypothetical protein
MEESVSEKSGFRSERSRMSALVEARDLIRELAEPRPVGDTAKAAVRRAYQRLETWTFNRVRDVWNADPRIRVRGDELDELRQAAAARRNKSHQKAAADELTELRQRIARLEQLIEQARAPLNRAGVPAHGKSLGAVVPTDRALD